MKFRKSIVNCLYCGAAFEKKRTDHVYCGPECRIRARNEKVLAEIPPERLCRFNQGVECPPNGRECQNCGWNPPVAEARLRIIRKELGCESAGT